VCGGWGWRGEERGEIACEGVESEVCVSGDVKEDGVHGEDITVRALAESESAIIPVWGVWWSDVG
jgi:hypothetical protein